MGSLRHFHRIAGTTALLTALTLAGGAPASADNVTTLGSDGVTHLGPDGLDFGTVCANTTVTRSVYLTASRVGIGNNTANVFANGSTVTFAAGPVSFAQGSVQPADLAVTLTSGVTLPSNWFDYPQNSTSPTKTAATVTLDSGPSVSSGSSAKVTFTGAGINADGAKFLTPSTSLSIMWKVVSCDDQSPVLNLPAPISQEATSAKGATVHYTASALPTGTTIACSPPSGSVFPLGATTVACDARTSSGNSTTGKFTVTVTDTTGPQIGDITDIKAEATGPDGAKVSYDVPVTTDDVDGPGTASCSPASGSLFPLGTSTVTCSAKDSAGNTSARTFTVDIVDTTSPVLVLPDDLTEEATGPSGRTIDFTASAHDAVDGDVVPECSAQSGQTFALGSTDVKCTASDTRSNTTSGQFTITVRDTTPPSITVPAGILAEATGPSGATVAYTVPEAFDTVSGQVPVSCSPGNGTVFALGDTDVTCSARDDAGNEASIRFTVSVVDTTAPELTLPAVLVPATSSNGAVAEYSATANDLVDGALTPVCTPASGSSFPIGNTAVNCTVEDARHNKAEGQFLVMVRYGRDAGILQPINPDNSSLFSRGRAVPVKFRLAGDQPAGFTTTAWTISRTSVSCSGVPGTESEAVPSTTPFTTLRYDSTADQYIYNADFRDKTVGTCWKVQVDLKDGSQPLSSAMFKLTK